MNTIVRETTPYRQWALAWFGAAGLGVLNGIARDVLYTERIGEQRSHQVSTATLGAATAVYVRALQRRWPIPTARAAACIGAGWLVATLGFEFGMGRLVTRKPWPELLHDYDVRRGRWWPFFLVWLAAAPAFARITDGSGPRPLSAAGRPT